MTAPTPNPAEEIARDCLAVRARMVSRAVSAIYDEVLRPHGLTTPQLNMLVAVALAGRMSPATLGAVLQMEKSTVSRNTERMVEAGWLAAERGPSGRRNEYAVTAAGRDLLDRIREPWRQAQERARALLGEDGAAALCQAAARVARPGG